MYSRLQNQDLSFLLRPSIKAATKRTTRSPPRYQTLSPRYEWRPKCIAIGRFNMLLSPIVCRTFPRAFAWRSLSSLHRFPASQITNSIRTRTSRFDYSLSNSRPVNGCSLLNCAGIQRTVTTKSRPLVPIKSRCSALSGRGVTNPCADALPPASGPSYNVTFYHLSPIWKQLLKALM